MESLNFLIPLLPHINPHTPSNPQSIPSNFLSWLLHQFDFNADQAEAEAISRFLFRREEAEAAKIETAEEESATIMDTKPKSRRCRKKKSKEFENGASSSSSAVADEDFVETKFLGEPVEPEEALRRWPHRYTKPSDQKKQPSVESNNSDDDEEFLEATLHFTRADVGGCIYNLFDDAHVKYPSSLYEKMTTPTLKNRRKRATTVGDDNVMDSVEMVLIPNTPRKNTLSLYGKMTAPM